MSVLKAHLAAASDTIYPGQSLAWNQTLTSKSGIFEMGFFRPDKSHPYNLGIWYKMIAEFTVVWEKKNIIYSDLDPASMALELSKDRLWVTQRGVRGDYLASYSNSTIVVGMLHDDGNFILRNKLDDIVLWQTFEEATDTWLPGAKLWFGFNTISTETNMLLSPSRWFSADLELEQNGTGHLVLCYWSPNEMITDSYKYGGNLSWKELTKQYINTSYVSNMNESYFLYYVVSPYTFARFVLNSIGELILYVWDEDLHRWNLVWKAPQQRCEIAGFYGEYGICNQQNGSLCNCPKGFRPRYSINWDLYDYEGGCERITPLRCSDDKFLTMHSVLFPEISHLPAVKNVEECKLNCLISCHCVAYSYNNGCSIFKGTPIYLQPSSGNELGGDFHIHISAYELVGIKTNMLKKATWIAGHSLYVV